MQSRLVNDFVFGVIILVYASCECDIIDRHSFSVKLRHTSACEGHRSATPLVGVRVFGLFVLSLFHDISFSWRSGEESTLKCVLVLYWNLNSNLALDPQAYRYTGKSSSAAYCNFNVVSYCKFNILLWIQHHDVNSTSYYNFIILLKLQSTSDWHLNIVCNCKFNIAM